MVKHSNKFSLVLIVTSFLLVSCKSGTGPSVPVENRSSAASSATNHETHDQALKSADHYLQMAAKSTPPQSYEYQLLATEMYIRANEIKQAKQWMASTPQTKLPPRLQTHHKILKAEIALAESKPTVAIDTLRSQTQIHPLSKSHQIKILELQALAYLQVGDPFHSAQARAQLDELLIHSQSRQQNRNALWQALGDVPISQLQNQGSDPVFHGWTSLALILRSQDVALLEQNLEAWQDQYPRHAAADFMPRSRQTRMENNFKFPNQIAILLPLSGTHKKAAEAIRDGFLTRYYSDEFGHSAKPKIQIYDTTSTEDIQIVYKKALQEGADFIIGPLMKQNVLSLSKMPSASVPILALNQNNAIKRAPKNFYQFALAPEDEAEQIAAKAAALNFKNAAVVVPNNNWGNRISDAFTARWHGLGGHLVSSVQVSAHEDQAKAIRALLNIENSQARSNQVKMALKEKVSFQPRRRQDIDVIVLAAPPEQARQLKPLFNFYFAEDLQVLATSSVYAGKLSPSIDQDMNGIMFCDMPWLLSKDKKSYTTKAMINHHWPSEATEYARLFAMGVDAYDLSGQLAHLENYPHSQYQGATGFLSLGSDYRIDRRLVWAQFDKGIPKLVN